MHRKDGRWVPSTGWVQRGGGARQHQDWDWAKFAKKENGKSWEKTTWRFPVLLEKGTQRSSVIENFFLASLWFCLFQYAFHISGRVRLIEKELKPEWGDVMARVCIRLRVSEFKGSVPTLSLHKLMPILTSPGSAYPSVSSLPFCKIEIARVQMS